jgi:hypothetical protein
VTANCEEFSVEFGPLEQRGVLLGISAPSLGCAAVGVGSGLVLLFTVGGTAGLFGALIAMVAGLAVALVPVQGTPLAEWILVLGGFLARTAAGRAAWRSHSPSAGTRARGATFVDLPEPLRRARTRVVAVPFLDRQVGVIVDGPLAIGVLKARAASAFLMRQPDDQLAATSGWGDAIGSIADSGSPWVRLQWRDATAPVDTGALVSFVADAMCPAARTAGTPENTARLAYERLVRTAAPVAESHEILIAAALDPRRVARQARDARGGHQGVGTVLVRHLEQLAYKLAAADVLVDGMLTPRQIGQVLREQVDPGERLWQSATVAADPEMRGVDPGTGWLLAADEEFASYRTDGAWHATLWVKEWPRRRARVDFLAPLLLRTGSITRIVSVTMAPVDPVTALRQAEDAATSDESDEELRGRFGVRTSGRRRREHAAATRREEELLDGWDDVRFSGYITVSAPTADALEEAVADVQAQARAARLRLVRLVGQQPEAFWYTAPLCRGVR